MAIFEVGEEYSRRDVANVLGEERVALSREGPVYLASEGIALLFVTLNKTGRAENLKYNDWFEGRNFHWDSQTTQHFATPRIQDMISGRLQVWLFVRINDRDARRAVAPFVCAGRLKYLTHDEATANPVHVVWQCVDFIDEPPATLRDIYAWRTRSIPATPAPTLYQIDRKNRQRGQGFIANAKVRKAVELRAMTVAIEWYSSLGFSVKDTSKNNPYDLLCTRNGDVRRVEVKGTMGGAERVLLTRGEVSAAEEAEILTDLFIVCEVVLDRATEDPLASGGRVQVVLNWIPQREHLAALQYEYLVPPNTLNNAFVAKAALEKASA